MVLSTTLVGALAALLSVGTAAPTAACDRDAILATTKTYLAGVASGKLDDLQKLFTSDFQYMENNKKSDIKTGVLSKIPLKLDHQRSTADTTACATYSEFIATAGPYVVGTQIRFSADGKSITMLDVVAATTGSWLFNAKNTLGYVKDEDWGPIDEAKRSSREKLKAVADAYLDMWSNSTAVDAVPWGTPCARTEGAMHISPSCTVGVPRGGTPSMKNGNRRYVIDEVTGTAEVLCNFGGSTGGMPDSHEFRLVSGKLVLVHTITV